MSRVTVLTDVNFKTEVLKSELPVLVDFWASWCPPCKMLEQTLEALTSILDGAVKIAKINVDQNPTTACEYNIGGVPTFIVFKSGSILSKCVGAQSKQQLLDILKETGVYNE